MQKRLPVHLSTLSKSTLESLCVDCGICCHAAVPVAKGVNAVIPELHCKHLQRDCDGKTACGVYDKRLDVAKGWCNALEDAIEKGLFPNNCPYVSNMPGYVGTTVLSDNVYKAIKPQIKKALVAEGMPDWVSAKDWTAFMSED